MSKAPLDAAEVEPSTANEASAVVTADADDTAMIALPPELTISHLQPLLKQLNIALDHPCRRLEFHAGGVQRVDSAALQLLLVFINEIKAQQASEPAIHWLNPSTTLQQSAALLDLREALTLPTH